MSVKSKIKKFKENPFKLIPYIDSKVKLKVIPDKLFLKVLYRSMMGAKLDLKNPKTFNEKLQWLKIHDRNPLYTKLADKYEVRSYVEKKIGSEYLVPLLGVYDEFDEIDFEALPNQFVLKCNHDSGGVIICRNKSEFDINAAERIINKYMKKNYFWSQREWPYKNINPKIICEKYMEDEKESDLKDYKFFCFNGEPKLMFVASDRATDTKFDFFDLDFNHLPIKNHYENSDKEILKPDGFHKMIELSKSLSKDIPHVRVDFYEVNGNIYFGELTFYHFSGLRKFKPNIYDERMGGWLSLSELNNK